MSYEELMNEYKETLNKYNKTLNQYTEALNKYNETKNEYKETIIENENLRLENNNLKRLLFGVKREYTPQKAQEETSIQCSLFDDELKELDEEIQKQIEENVEEVTVYKKKKSKERKSGIKKSELKNIEIEVKEYDINKEERCPVCDGELKEVSKEVVRQEIKYIPGKFVLTNNIKYTYKCKECGGKNSDNASFVFMKTRVPKPVITHSFASPSLATEVIYQKYYIGVPLYRQEKMWDDRGLVLPRNMMANWNIKISEYYFNKICELMYKTMKAENEVLHDDETKMQCNKEAGRKASSNSYMWVSRSGEKEKKQGIIFMYSPSRSEKTAKEFTQGFKGILVTDGYSSYNNLEGVTHAECWAHARRYFYESIPLDENKKLNTNAYGYQGLEYCNKLFKIEEKIANLSMDEKVKIRQEKSKPIIEDFYKWVSSMMEKKIILNNKLTKALTYVTNQRKELTEFLNDGRIPLTNSLAERSIRPFAVHRKNWLFADSVDGAKANATMYSIIESAKINRLNIWKYIKYLLDELPQLENINDEKALEKYLPWSEELPAEIQNYEGEYKELKVD